MSCMAAATSALCSAKDHNQRTSLISGLASVAPIGIEPSSSAKGAEPGEVLKRWRRTLMRRRGLLHPIRVVPAGFFRTGPPAYQTVRRGLPRHSHIRPSFNHPVASPCAITIRTGCASFCDQRTPHPLHGNSGESADHQCSRWFGPTRIVHSRGRNEEHRSKKTAWPGDISPS